MLSKTIINFKTSRSAENFLFKPHSLTADIIASIVDWSFKYFTIIWDSVPVVDTMCCLMFLKAPNFIISSTSAGDGDVPNFFSLLQRKGSMFLVCDSSFVWLIAANASLYKRLDRK